MNHLMVDLETMGNGPHAPVISIGAVFFDPNTGETGEEFSVNISLESSMRYRARPDASTILWWMEQSEEARKSLTSNTQELPTALSWLSEFIIKNANHKFVQVWGNGASFDCVILRNSYSLTGQPVPWQWWNDRDVRTIVELGKVIGFDPKRDMPFKGTRHNALDDAIHQAKYVSAIWKRVSLKQFLSRWHWLYALANNHFCRKNAGVVCKSSHDLLSTNWSIAMLSDTPKVSICC